MYERQDLCEYIDMNEYEAIIGNNGENNDLKG